MFKSLLYHESLVITISGNHGRDDDSRLVVFHFVPSVAAAPAHCRERDRNRSESRLAGLGRGYLAWRVTRTGIRREQEPGVSKSSPGAALLISLARVTPRHNDIMDNLEHLKGVPS